MKNILLPLFIIGGLASGCQTQTEEADAYGTFEAREVLVSAELSGPLLFLNVDEGMTLDSGQLVGLVDTMPLYLQRQQIEARIKAIRQKVQREQPQIDVLLAQKANLEREVQRLEGLLREQAVPEQQVDDLRGQIDVVQNRILATRDKIQTANRSVLSEIEPLEAQSRTLTDKLDRCRIYNPIDGRVLMQLTEPEEMVQMGHPLYKIADLSELTLRAYVTGSQLPHLNLGQSVGVWIDHHSGELQQLPGTVTWIADEAEFTPKIVQTRDERVNLVYAVKVRVRNDGRLKIGMPGELTFMPEQKPES